MAGHHTRYDRQKLYEEVWAEPVQAVAKRYGVSGVALAKVCRGLGVPVPGRGYWAKVAAGQPPAKPPLPGVADRSDAGSATGESGSVTRPQSHAGGRGSAPLASPTATVHGRCLAEETRDALKHCWPSRGPFPRPYRRAIADISVSPAVVDRAVTLAGRLYAEFERASFHVMIAPPGGGNSRSAIDMKARGGSVTWDDTPWSPLRPTVAVRGNATIGLAIYETAEDVDVVHHDGKWIRRSEAPPPPRHRGWSHVASTTTRSLPTGRLRVLAYAALGFSSWRKDWTEQAGSALAAEVSAIVSEVCTAVPTIEAEDAEGRRRWEAQQAAWAESERRRAAERAAEQRRRDEDAARGEILQIVDGWSLARHADAFFDDARGRAAALPHAERQQVEARIAAARSLLGGTDALARLSTWRAPPAR